MSQIEQSNDVLLSWIDPMRLFLYILENRFGIHLNIFLSFSHKLIQYDFIKYILENYCSKRWIMYGGLILMNFFNIFSQTTLLRKILVANWAVIWCFTHELFQYVFSNYIVEKNFGHKLSSSMMLCYQWFKNIEYQWSRVKYVWYTIKKTTDMLHKSIQRKMFLIDFIFLM